MDLSQLLAELYVTTTLRCEFSLRFHPVFKYLASRYSFPNGIALGYFTDGANIVIAAVSDVSLSHLFVGQVIADPVFHEVPLQTIIIDGSNNFKAVLLIAKTDIDELTFHHHTEISGPWHAVKSAVSAAATVLKELQGSIDRGSLSAFPLFPATKRPIDQASESHFLQALQQEASSLIAAHVSDEKV
jgi:hypothetical protein